MIWQISIREGMKAAEQRMKELQKLIAAVIGICCSVTLWYMSIDTSNKTVREIADEILKL